MTPTNATIHLYKDREGFWKARIEWADPETGKQKMLSWDDDHGAVFAENAVTEIAAKWSDRIGL